MLYELVGLLGDFPGQGLFAYTSFRAALALLTAFALALASGPVTIAWLARAGVREDTQKTDSERLAELHAGKRRTPTMGGVFLVGSLLVSGLLWMRFDGFHVYSWIGLALIGWFAVVGWIDDRIKLLDPVRSGLSKRQKQLALTLGAAVCAGLLLAVGLESDHGGPFLYLPLWKDAAVPLGGLLGVPFVVVGVLVLTGSANAVNLTDGLDGLAAGCVLIAALALAGIGYLVGHAQFAEYLLVRHVPGAAEIAVLMAALAGACMGFLWFNAHPAQVFMGDVGSLALGGALGYAAVVSRTELVLFVVGGVFVAEALSVVLQVWSFKTRGRRVFRCAPLHHHFQFGGMPETRIVARAWILAALLALGSLLLFKIR